MGKHPKVNGNEGGVTERVEGPLVTFELISP